MKEENIPHITKEDNWPIRKRELMNKHLKEFIYFTNYLDYEKL